MQAISRHQRIIEDIESDKVLAAKTQQDKAIVNPLSNPLNSYYIDTIASAKDSSPSVGSVKAVKSIDAANPYAEKNIQGWNHADTIAQASGLKEVDVVAKPANPTYDVQGLPSPAVLTITQEKVPQAEVEKLLEKSYNDVSAATRQNVDAMLQVSPQTPELLKHHYDILSKNIDEALKAENRDYEKIHAMILRFCMIHMRNVSKEDQEYISRIGDQIKVQAGKIRDTHNTYPVVIITLVSSVISIGGGIAGFSSLIHPNSELARTFAQNAHQISTASTGISGVSSLFNSRNEGDRQIMQLIMKRDQDKEEEKKGSKHGNKESQKLHSNALIEFFRNIRDTISSILRG